MLDDERGWTVIEHWELLQGWRGPGALFVSTHQVNITSLTGIVPASGKGVVVTLDGTALRVIGRIRP